MCCWHAPLQNMGDMLIRSTRNRIPRCESKWVCAHWRNALLCVYGFVHVCVYSWIYVQAHEQTLDWLACAVAVSKQCHFVPRSQGCNPSNPKQRNDLGKTMKVNDSEFNIGLLSPLTAREKAACTVLGQPALQWVQEGCMFALESEPRVVPVLYRNEILHLTRSVTRF